MAYLVADPAVRHIVACFDFTNMNNRAKEVIGARSLKLDVFSAVTTACAIRIWQHIELKRESYCIVDLGGGSVMSTLSVLEPLIEMLARVAFPHISEGFPQDLP